MLRKRQVPWLLATLLGLTLLVPDAPAGAGPSPGPSPGFAAPTQPGQVSTVPDWRLQSSATATQGGDAISRPAYDDRGWLTVPARSTVFGGLLANNKYGDVNYSTNLRDKVNKADFAVAWWYRRSFTAPPQTAPPQTPQTAPSRTAQPGGHTFLRLTGGVIPRAEVWLNGTRVAGPDQVAGAYPAHEFDVTSLLTGGANALAIKAFPADPKKDLAISFVDWSPPAPDNDMGVWRDVQFAQSGAVSVRNARVVTALALPGLASADLTVRAEVRNNTNQSVNTQVSGTINAIAFSQQITLKPNETRTVSFAPDGYPSLRVANPKVWWPYQYGDQPLYHLSLAATVNGQPSDSADTDFGIRDVKSTLTDAGSMRLTVNGKDMLIRGGGWSSDLFLRYDRQRMTDQLSYVRDLGLNTVRLEGKEENDELYQLADQLGIMLLPGWECCSWWQSDGKWSELDHATAKASAVTEGARLRNHPSVVGFYVGSDETPSARTTKDYVDGLNAADWQVPIIPSAAKRTNAQLGDSGNKMAGPYWWVPPNYWYATKFGGAGAAGFASEVGPGPTISDLDALRKYLSPTELTDLWKNPTKAQYHLSPSGVFSKLGSFHTALAARYGAPTSLEDFTRKAQLTNYEVNRAQFEAYGRDQSDARNPATGVIYWMLNNPWPTIYWHLFDNSLAPSGSYFGAKSALRPLHAQYSYDDRSIALVNTGLADRAGLSVQTTVFDLDGTVRSDSTRKSVTAKGNGSVSVDTMPKPAGLSTTYFVRLLVRDAGGQVLDRNVYWLSTKDDQLDWAKSTWYDTPQSGYADLTGLQRLKQATVDVSSTSTPTGDRMDTAVTLSNKGSSVAFFLRASIRRGVGGAEVTPVTWSDDYVTIWPGESVTVHAQYRQADLGGATPTVQVSGMNTH
ncbi:glycoside hydrolase family 2 protein [Solihabitans fulvus]|nr:exo-beta-D-glucosaminidase [Solihabitans fulvus]